MYGAQFGYNLSKTVRFVVSKASEAILKESAEPVYQMSERTERLGLQALKEHAEGKTTKVSNIAEFFNTL